MKSLKILLPCICCALFLTACTSPGTNGGGVGTGADEKNSRTILAMETAMDLTVYGGDETVLDQMERCIKDLDKALSVTNKSSQIFKLNAAGKAKVSPDVYSIVEHALEFSKATDGAFDISIYPLVKAWGFTLDNPHVPSASEINSARSVIDYRKIKLEAGEIHVDEGMQIDLGGIAKGYLGDELVKILKKNGIKSALLNLGGNVVTHGYKPDGSEWNVAITDPNGEDYAGIIAVHDKCVITSGGYERFFTDENGKKYWHIMDASTGYPADKGLISVTIVGKSGIKADAMSTALFVMGTEKAVEFSKTQKDFDVILISKDGELYVSEAIADNFKPTGAYADKMLHLI